METIKDHGRIPEAGGCSSCGKSSTVRDYQRNVLICGNFGRILKEEIKDRGPEW